MTVKRLVAVLGVLALSGRTSTLQDAGKVLDEAGKLMSAAQVKSIQYSGTGFAYIFGQNYSPDGPPPKFYAKYSRTIDFEKGLSKEDMVRTQFENPPRGGGQQPIYTEARTSAVVTDSSPWGTGAVALTPYGWLKAAAAANPTIGAGRLDGKPVTVVSFTYKDKYTVNGYLNAQHLLEKTETWTANPILGDIPIETSFSEYKDFGGVKFPTHIVQKQGGFSVLELTVADVQPNAPADIQAPPPPPPVKVEGVKVAEGVWYLDGTPDPNSVAVEFKDYTVIIESSVSEGRALANMAEVKRLVPNKPIRYHVNSHHHSDHAAGLRAFIAEGSTIITHEMNRKLYENVVFKAPHALQPDRLSQNPTTPKIVWVSDKYELTDGDRTLQIFHMQGQGHAANLLMSYLPKEKLLVVTDAFNQFGRPAPNDPPPGIVTPYYGNLGDNIKRLGLEIERIAPSHGKGVVPAENLFKLLNGTVQAPAVKPIADVK